MRVITGSAKGHRLKAPKGMTTRPMLDRVKEALFSVLEGYGPIRGRVLDLYAGTGSLGIECLSRGAAWADFVEMRAHVCAIIRDNLAHTRLTERARVYQMPVGRYVASAHPPEKYDIIGAAGRSRAADRRALATRAACRSVWLDPPPQVSPSW
jgi:16S rRNA (guanine(966)-N(2))-methyltransferase RsmD